MPAKFHPVTPAMWDRTMRELSPEAKLVRLYLLTCANRLSEGLFYIPVGIMAHDTGLSLESVERAMSELESVALVSYDREAEVVLDRTALRYAPLRNGKDKDGNVKRNMSIPGAVRLFENVPDTPLKHDLFQLAAEHSPDLREALEERLPSLRPAIPRQGRPALAPLEPALSSAQGASASAEPPRRAEPVREEREMQSKHESSGTPLPVGALILCAHCSESAMMIRPGEPKLYNGHPYCGWCVGTLV